MEQQQAIEKCRRAASQIRRDIIEMAYSAGNQGAHLGGSLSMTEIFAALYVSTLRFHRNDPNWSERDRVILSKGHAALAWYPALVQGGVLAREVLQTYKQNGSKLSGHPARHKDIGIEFASGSLGQGLSLGVGVCLALKRQGNMKSRVYVLLGDGECDEGSIWEAAASASHFGLHQLIAIVDENKIQYDGYTSAVMNIQPTEAKWRSFGWDVRRVDGHDVGALLDVLSQRGGIRPVAILADTVKGKGVSFMEGNWRFHNARLTEQQYTQAMAELEAQNAGI